MEYKNNPYAIALTIVLSAAIAGGGVYFWQHNERQEKTPESQEAVKTPETKKSDDATKPVETVKTPASTDTPISFLRAGLITEADRTEIQKNFVNPMAECSRTTTNPGNPIVAVVITVPQNIGEQYLYSTVAKNSGGSEGYYGKRGFPIPVFQCIKDGMGIE